MTIDWNNFTLWSSLLGGALIGAAAALFIVFNGRIAGISGVLGGLLRPASLAPGDAGWRVTFVLGLLVAPLVYLLLAAWPAVQVDASYGALVLAGLMVGVGTRYGAGWGVAGFCPGPALVALGMGVPQAYVFVLAMLVGMGLFEAIERWQATTRLP